MKDIHNSNSQMNVGGPQFPGIRNVQATSHELDSLAIPLDRDDCFNTIQRNHPVCFRLGASALLVHP